MSLDARNITQGGQVIKYMIGMFIQITNIVVYWSLLPALGSFFIYLFSVMKWVHIKHGTVYWLLFIKAKFVRTQTDQLYHFSWETAQGKMVEFTRTGAQILNDSYFIKCAELLKQNAFYGWGISLAVFFFIVMVVFWFLGRKGHLQRKDELIGGRFLAPSAAYVNKLLKKTGKLSPLKIGDLHLVKNTRDMKKITFVALAALTITACSSGPEFEVNGDISGADGKMLYLEASGLEGIVPLDSVKLKGEGTFKFKQPRPESPEFYRLRVDNKVINFSVDSIETLQINAPYVDFSTAYTVEGSENSSKIKELTLKQINLQKNVDEQLNALRANKLGHDTFEENLATLLKNYKEDVKVNYIFAAPNTAAAYFALFQKLNDYLIFDPLNNKDDVKCFAAVATSLNNTYPDAVRSKNLYNIVIKGMKNTRQPQSKSLEIPQDKIIETGIIDIALRDVKGNTRKLTDLKGKVVLLDFSVFQSPAGAPHNMMLRELYNKYAKDGLEIYQVSLDADEHYWKTAAGNLPWVCVRDGNGVYSTNVAVYNVRQVPSIFLINRNNELKLRGEDIKDLEASVKSLL